MTCLVQSQFLDSSLAVLLTNTTTQTMRIDMLDVRNNDVASQTFTAHIVPSGGTASAATIRISETVGVGATVIVRELIGHDLNPGDSFQAFASLAGAVSIRISGRLVST